MLGQWLVSVRTLFVLAVFSGLVATSGWLYVGKTRIEAKLATYKAQVAQQTATYETRVRATERRLTETTERLTDELAKKDRLLASRAAAARAADGGLRDEIARLNARATPEDPQLAAAVGEARIARELLGTCSRRYSELAKDADGLRDQVNGLQFYIENVRKIMQ